MKKERDREEKSQAESKGTRGRNNHGRKGE